MSTSEWKPKVGDVVEAFELGRVLYTTTIVRETKAYYFDDRGNKWDKKTLLRYPRYLDIVRVIRRREEAT